MRYGSQSSWWLSSRNSIIAVISWQQRLCLRLIFQLFLWWRTWWIFSFKCQNQVKYARYKCLLTPCFPCVCMGFLWLLHFPITVRQHAVRSFGDSKLPLGGNGRVNGLCAVWWTDDLSQLEVCFLPWPFMHWRWISADPSLTVWYNNGWMFCTNPKTQQCHYYWSLFLSCKTVSSSNFMSEKQEITKFVWKLHPLIDFLFPGWLSHQLSGIPGVRCQRVVYLRISNPGIIAD